MPPSIDKLLFTAASAFVEAAERRAFLEFACKGDPARLKQLEELLAIQRDAEEFFELQPEVGAPAGAGAAGEGDGGLGASIGPYRLIDRLGAGGCGVVYLAEQQVPVKRRVALKIIRLGMDTEKVIARFSLEREALALMDHPNIARVLDAGVTASGLPYFVMELVAGERITDFCDHNRLGLRQRLELFISVCEAIQHAHQKGVIHRDIKPSNVLVREHDGRAVPKVIDFGIAKATEGNVDADGTVTNFGQFIGTPAYMSPEQAEGGGDIDTRTDIYSLGILLYELLTGKPPLDPENLKDRGIDEIRGILREGETSVPSVKVRKTPAGEIGEIARNRGVDPQRLPSLLAGDLDWIVMKAIEPERQRRYETANGLAMDVHRNLSEQPVLARPPSRRYLLSKLVRRNRVTFAAASIALFGLLGGLAVSTWLFVREREARQEQARLRVMAEQATANEVRLRQDAKAVDMVAQAAVHLKYEQVEQMDQVLAGVTADQVPRSLEAARVFERVANWHLTHKRWKTASDRFYVLGHILCGVDMTDREDISFNFLPFLTAVSEWGNPGEYDQLRTLTLRRFGSSANIIVAEHITKGTLLEPADAKTLAEVEPLAKVLQASFEGDNKETRTHMIAWRKFSLGLMAYRQDHLIEAGRWARESLAKDQSSDPRKVSNELILAMIDLKEGRIEKARKEVARLRVQVDGWFNGPFLITNPDKTLWYNQVAVRGLLREAEKLAAQKAN